MCKVCGLPSGGAGYCKECTGLPDNKDTLVYQVKPTFNWWYQLFVISPLFIGPGLFTFIFSTPLFIVVCATVIFILLFEKKRYAGIEYNFYARKVRYVKGLFMQEREIRYEDITGVAIVTDIGATRIRISQDMGCSLNIDYVDHMKEHYSQIKALVSV